MNPINQDPNAQYLVYTNNQQQPQQQPKKKKHGCLIAFLIVLGVFILLCAAVTPFVIKEVKYGAAEAFILMDDYDSAISAFESLGTYRDSADRIVNTKYQQAQYYAENGEYEDAIEVLQDITPYEDSDELIEQYIISYMDTLVEDKAYNDLEDYLEIAQDLEGSDELEDACKYYEGILAYHDREYEDAAKALYELGDYKEAEKYYAMAAHYYYSESYKTVNSKETAEDIFEKLANYKDDTEINGMLTNNIYNYIKLKGVWKCETGESLIFTDSQVQLDIPVSLNRYKSYYIASSGDYVVAVEKTSNEITRLFKVVSFDEPDVLRPKTLTILNEADNKEYVFKRVS